MQSIHRSPKQFLERPNPKVGQIWSAQRAPFHLDYVANTPAGGSVIMRKLVPPKKNNPAHATNHYIWVASAMRNPALLSAYVYGNLTHELAFRWMRGELTPEYKRQLMMQIMVAELEAINRISEALADPQQRFSEELTLAIFLMGYSYVSERQLPSDRSQHMSPLRDLQWASVYSVLEYNTTHVNGLMQLISLRGGLDAIKMPGLVEMLSLGAIMFATKSLTKPMCPYIPLNKTNGKHVQPDWPPSIQSLLDSSGDSGSHPSNLLGVGIPVDAISLLQDMRSFSRVVEFFMKGIMTIETSEPELSFIADRRNWIQHKALSLPPASELPPSEFTPIYEPLRYAMISYSILVVFTVLPSLAPFPRLSRLIKQAIIDYPVRKEWDLQMMHVLVWILVIGGIISSDEETGTWFAGLLGVVSSTIGINSWADLRVILASVVWVDHDEGLDPRARAFWDKVVSLQHGAFDHMGSGSRL